MKYFFLIAGLLIAAGCVTAGTPQPPAAEIAQMEDVEKRILETAAKEAREIEASGFVYRDENLERYLDSIARKLAGAKANAGQPFRIHVIRSPYLNAFAMPDGNLYVYTGIIAAMENEAQLATVLAHEMVHTMNKHAVRQYREIRERTAFYATLSAALAGFGGAALGQIGMVASVSGYAQGLETEADVEAMRLLRTAGYDPREAPAIFRELEREAKEEEKTEPYFFGSHPRLQERIANFDRLSREGGAPGGEKNAGVFLDRVRQLVLDNTVLDQKAGRFARAERILKKYTATYPADARGYYLLGETCRQRNGKGDMEAAAAHYRKAIDLDVRNADAHRGLGIASWKIKEMATAARELRRYLELAPQAKDRAYIEGMLKGMEVKP